MEWQIAVGLGAVGGALVEAINVYGLVTDWQTARHDARACGDEQLPPLTKFIDVPADSLVALTRFALGAAAGLIFHTQIVGWAAAIAVGASAPAMLRQLGTARTIRDAVQSTSNGFSRSRSSSGTGPTTASASPTRQPVSPQEEPGR